MPTLCRLAADAFTVPGDFASIQAAVASASVGDGDLIIVTANTNNDDADVNNKDVTIVGTGQTMQGTAANAPAIRIRGGSVVVVQGLVVRTSGNGENAIDLASGSLTLRAVSITQSNGVGVNQSSGTTLTVQRSLVTGMPAGGFDLRGAYVIENSVLRNNSVRGVQFLTGSSGTFRFNTVTGNPVGTLCTQAATLSASILFGNTTTNTQGSCTTTTSLVGVDPLFAADGFHINAGSPAIDAATVACPAVDLDNDLRPIGLACDIGADERP